MDFDEDDEDVDMEDLGFDEEVGVLKWKDSMFECVSKFYGNRRLFCVVDFVRFMYDIVFSFREVFKKWRCEEEEEEEEDIEKDEDDIFFRKIGDDE